MNENDRIQTAYSYHRTEIVLIFTMFCILLYLHVYALCYLFYVVCRFCNTMNVCCRGGAVAKVERTDGPISLPEIAIKYV